MKHLATPHALLGVRYGDDPEVVRSAYHKLCRQYHPDKTGNDDGSKFGEIHAAYEQIKRGWYPMPKTESTNPLRATAKPAVRTPLAQPGASTLQNCLGFERNALPLSCAIRNGDAEHVLVLIGGNKNPNTISLGLGNRPLHFCAFLSELACAELLLERASPQDVRARNDAGETPLDIADAQLKVADSEDSSREESMSQRLRVAMLEKPEVVPSNLVRRPGSRGNTAGGLLPRHQAGGGSGSRPTSGSRPSTSAPLRPAPRTQSEGRPSTSDNLSQGRSNSAARFRQGTAPVRSNCASAPTANFTFSPAAPVWAQGSQGPSIWEGTSSWAWGGNPGGPPSRASRSSRGKDRPGSGKFHVRPTDLDGMVQEIHKTRQTSTSGVN